MDFQKCLSILQERGKYQNQLEDKADGLLVGRANNTLKLSTYSTEESVTVTYSTTDLSDEILERATALELLQLFNDLQAKRIQTYQRFDGHLAKLIEETQLDQYPILCTDITKIFSAISLDIIRVKDQLANKEQKELSELIIQIQQLEKEKLLLIAAKHLDIMQNNLQCIEQLTGGKSEQQVKYLTDKINDIESSIRNVMEEIQCLKCDLL